MILFIDICFPWISYPAVKNKIRTNTIALTYSDQWSCFPHINLFQSLVFMIHLTQGSLPPLSLFLSLSLSLSLSLILHCLFFWIIKICIFMIKQHSRSNKMDILQWKIFLLHNIAYFPLFIFSEKMACIPREYSI